MFICCFASLDIYFLFSQDRTLEGSIKLSDKNTALIDKIYDKCKKEECWYHFYLINIFKRLRATNITIKI
ncbi:hypothetical protein KMU_30120 [Proteus vulgaris]|nr:hypothetical protein KMU_30120 [Proteus vulgaris]